MKTYTAFVAVFFCALSAYGQALTADWTIQFYDTTLHGNATGGFRAYAVHQMADKGFVLTGHCCGMHLNGDMFLIRTDSLGNEIWSKRLDDDNRDEVGQAIGETSDGGIIVAGNTPKYDWDTDIMVVRIDASGNEQWRSFIGASGTNIHDGTYSLQVTPDNGCVLAGYTLATGAGGADAYLVRLDASGTIRWSKTYGGPKNDWARCIRKTADGGYIMCGATWSTRLGETDLYLIRTDSLGDTLWTRTYGKAGVDDGGLSVEQTADNGFIITGYTEDWTRTYLVRINAQGNLVWEKSISTGEEMSEHGRSVRQAPDGGFVIAGLKGLREEFMSDNVADNAHKYLLRTDAAGNVVWSRTFEGCTGWPHAFCIIFSMIMSDNNKVIIAGREGADRIFLTQLSGL